MGLSKVLEQKQEQVVKKWFDALMKTYPKEKTQFLAKSKDSFSNPIGNTLNKSLKEVFEGLLKGDDIEKMRKVLDPAIRVRAVQEFSPSHCVSFVFFLKKIIRDFVKKDRKSKVSESELLNFESRIDGLSLIAFDIYMGCREQIFSFKANHVKDRTIKLLEKADLLCDVPDAGADIIPHNVYKNGGFNEE